MELNNINGIGPATIKELNKLNINSIIDLINYYPYKYNVYNPVDINNSIDNETIAINGIIESIPRINYIKRNFNRLTFRLLTNNKLINVTIFNRAYLSKSLKVNTTISIIGKYDRKTNYLTASIINLKPILTTKIEPVYHLSNGIKNYQLNKLILDTIKNTNIEETLPKYIIDKYNFIPNAKALLEIHKPTNNNILKQSKLKLIYTELFDFMFKINYLSNIKKEQNEYRIKKLDRKQLDTIIDDLPFKLTSDQLNSINDIVRDFISPKRINRLLIGDVGSGKTIVGFLAIISNKLSGYQSAFLAPTEILAIQHYNNATKLFKNINFALLTSSTKKSERNKIIEDLQNNKIDCIIGTHSIINEEIKFNNLGLVITDEQHRFGVNQRKNLQNKGYCVDVLYMSATPIPRTYALTIYGDMDISEIKTKPNGRKPVTTKLYKENDLKEVLSIMLKEIKLGHQIYVISPLVEENEELNLYDVEKLKEKLNIAFNNKVPIELLHGKLKSTEKDKIMTNFKENKTKILVSTTVIEVGVDVSNATTIVIFNAERFGLSTLHQLRGRVGRNNLDSYCLLISNYDKERLHILESSTDGFYISERDFELRGSGNLFGTEQSGEMIFKIADIKRDIKILKQANIDSKEFINKNLITTNTPYYNNLIKSIQFID